MIPTPIRQVLLTFQKHGVQALLMGGQASVFYGAAQVSKDIDFVLLADDANSVRLHAALAELQAERIAIPRFDLAVLNRGHAVHFRCRAPGVEGMRVDVMAKKTQRNKDWPVIELLATIHYRENSANPRADWIEFWLCEVRTPELLITIARVFPADARAFAQKRPLLALAIAEEIDPLRLALDTERQAEQALDRAYWEPLRKELEEFRRAERG